MRRMRRSLTVLCTGLIVAAAVVASAVVVASPAHAAVGLRERAAPNPG